MRSKGRAPCLDQHPWGFQPLPPGKPPGPELPWWVRATCTKPALRQTPELSHHSDTSGEGFCRAKEISTLLLPLDPRQSSQSCCRMDENLWLHILSIFIVCFSIPSSRTHSLCSSPKGLSTDTLHIRHCNGQPDLWCSLRQAHCQGSHGPLALDTMLRSDLDACCLWPMVSKAVSPKRLFPVFGVPPEPPPSPAA